MCIPYPSRMSCTSSSRKASVGMRLKIFLLDVSTALLSFVISSFIPAFPSADTNVVFRRKMPIRPSASRTFFLSRILSKLMFLKFMRFFLPGSDVFNQMLAVVIDQEPVRLGLCARHLGKRDVSVENGLGRRVT